MAMLKWLMLTQVASKLAGMLLNVVLVRRIGPAVFAISNKLDMASGFCLGIARETMRMALMRQSRESGESEVEWRARLMKMSMVSAVVGAVLGVCSIPVFCDLLRVDSVQSYKRAARYYCLSASVDMLAEPMIIQLMHDDLLVIRLIMETVFAVSKSAWLGYVAISTPDISLDDFVTSLGSSQIILTVTLFVLYIVAFMILKGKNMKIGAVHNSTISQNTIHELVVVYKQSIGRYVMAQADTLVGQWFSPLTLQEQGVFAMASNHVSLFPRIVQAPLEEHGFILFSRAIDKQSGEQQRAAYDYLKTVIRFDTLVGLLLVLFGTQYTGLFSRLLTKSNNDTAGLLSRVLSAAFFMLPIMSISGICESFVNATVGPLGMSRLQVVNMIVSIFNMMTCYAMARWFGAVGLVLASSISFAIRAFIAFSYVCMRPNRHKQINNFSVKSSLVTRLSIMAVGCAVVGHLYGFGSNMHVSCGVASMGIVSALVWQYEPSIIRLFVN